VRLGDFHFRYKERWTYEYDLADWWQHEIRLEQILPFDPAKRYPICLAGKRRAPLVIWRKICQEQGHLIRFRAEFQIKESENRKAKKKKAKKAKAQGICAYCGKIEKLSEDHVIPQCLFIGVVTDRQGIDKPQLSPLKRGVCYSCLFDTPIALQIWLLCGVSRGSVSFIARSFLW